MWGDESIPDREVHTYVARLYSYTLGIHTVVIKVNTNKSLYSNTAN